MEHFFLDIHTKRTVVLPPVSGRRGPGGAKPHVTRRARWSDATASEPAASSESQGSMDNSLVSTGAYDRAVRLTPVEENSSRSERPAVVEFAGASDDTIADAVRRALTHASRSLRTLEGAGVLVIPQIHRDGAAPRYRVTLRVTAGAATGHPTSPTPPTPM